MPEHATTPFLGLHKARFDSGTIANLPVAPEGNGDIYYATDTNALYVGVSSAWVLYTAPSANLDNDLIASMYMSNLVTKTPVRVNNIKTTTANTVVYTCPSNTTVTIKNISLYNRSAGVTSAIAYINTGGSDVRVIYNTALAVNDGIILEVPIVLEAGDTIKIENSAQPLHYNITGYAMADTITEVIPFRYAAVKASTSNDDLFSAGASEIITITSIIIHNANVATSNIRAAERVGANYITILEGTSTSASDTIYQDSRIIINSGNFVSLVNSVSDAHYIISGYITEA